MRYPTDDKKELEQLKAAKWQLDLLELNPSYLSWGCFEDYMSVDKEFSWDSRVILKNWKEHQDEWNLDELNELVNFYFKVYRENHECEICEGTTFNAETKRLYNDWYDSADTGRLWKTKITDVEVEALVKNGRIREVSNFNGWFDDKKNVWMKWEGEKNIECEKPIYPSAESVNIWAGKCMSHDGVNHLICVKARAKHLGVYGHCEKCSDGYVYDEPNARVALQLWYIHPRKGCSRGVYIENIEQEDLPSIFSYLKEAAKRNQQRFSKVV